MDDITRAAIARAAGVAQRSHRPSQRRCAEQTGSAALARFAAQRMELRDSSSDGLLTYDGYATTYDQSYDMWDMYGQYSEIVAAGAASDSLKRVGLDVPFVLGHDALRVMASTINGTLTLSEDEHGLRVLADALDPNDADVAYIAPKIRAGLIREMSFKFVITRGQWSPDYTEYRIDSFDLHRGDVSIVGFGANPNTSGELRTVDIARLRTRLSLALAH